MMTKLVFLLWFPLLATAGSRYMVELSGPSVAEHVTTASSRAGKRISLESETAKAHRRRLRDEQKQVRTALEALGVTVLDSTSTVSNTLIVDMPDSLAGRVRGLPGVKRAQKASPMQLHLDHALPIHRVPQAWAAAGGVASAGAGIKIGMIDSGIDIAHPGLQDSTLLTPPGFPKVNADTDTAYTNSKVIVARSYAALLPATETDLSAQDVNGHGTGTAMAAAGVQNTGSFGTISGVAPKAWLGAYKVIGATGLTSSDVVLKAVDDAVADGMDIINLSLGKTGAPRLADDVESLELERVAALGILVVVSAGNGSNGANLGDPNTIASPGTALSAITVGASFSDRIVYPASLTGPGGLLAGANTGDGALPGGPVTGPLFDVSTLDQSGDACLPFPQGTMQGDIALIIRGACTFEEKMNNAQGAGAVGALIYDYPGDNVLKFGGLGFGQGAATLPALIVDNIPGVYLKRQLAAGVALAVTLNFTFASIPATLQGVPGLSAGPSVDGSIKPDLLAVGTDVYTATESTDLTGELYDPSGYVTGVSGTSYSAPLVSGAAAVLKSFRPGLTSDQYRSLLINTAGPVSGHVMETGAGQLNVQSAVTSTFAVKPTALSFRIGDGNPGFSRTLTVSNVGNATESYSLSVTPLDPAAPAPSLGLNTITLAPGQSGGVPVSFTASDLAGGQYEGYVTILGSQSGVLERVPYWYGVPTNTPAFITPVFVAGPAGVGDNGVTYKAGDRINNAFQFRVTDSSGIVISDPGATVTAVRGGGSVVGTTSIDNQIPGVYRVAVRLGTKPGVNLFEIDAGDVTPYLVEIDGN